MTTFQLPNIDDDGEFRVLIDARKMVFFFFDQPSLNNSGPALQAFTEIAAKYPELSLTHIDLDKHPDLARRVMIEHTPALQIWIDGNLFWSHEDSSDINLMMLEHWLEKALDASEGHQLYQPIEQTEKL